MLKKNRSSGRFFLCKSLAYIDTCSYYLNYIYASRDIRDKYIGL